MVRLRFLAVALLALVFAGSPTQMGRSAGQSKEALIPSGSSANATDELPCRIYALSDMGHDSDLGQWISQTIPEMVEPRSWRENGQGGEGVLRYNAQKNILIVRNSSIIQAKVDGFLKDLNKSMPKGSERHSATSKKTPRASIIPAAYQPPAALPASGPVPEASSYPVPAPVKPPKHLFHFLIRYEGEGLIDDNVVKYFKVTSKTEKPETNEKVAEGRYLTHPPTYIPPYPNVDDVKEKEAKKDDEKGNGGAKPY